MNKLRLSFLGVVVLPTLVWPLIDFGQVVEQHEVRLSDKDMRSTQGGLVVSNFTFPADSSTIQSDNFQVSFDLANATGSTPIMEIRYNNVKQGAMVVATPTPNGTHNLGSYQARNSWPLKVYNANVSLTHCQFLPSTPSGPFPTCNLIPVGTNTKYNVSFPETVKVWKIWFHNTASTTEATARPAALNEAIVDDLTTWNYVSSVNSIDAIYSQCNNPIATQFRYHNTDLVPVGQNAIRVFISNPPPQNYQDVFVNTGFAQHMQTIDPSNEYFHVFFVKELHFDLDNDGVFDSVHAVNNLDLGDFDVDGVASALPHTPIRAVVLRDSMDPFLLTSVLAHEIGHAIGDLPHIASGTSLCPTSATPNNRNLMCTNAGAGRKVINTVAQPQCTRMHDVANAITLKDHHEN